MVRAQSRVRARAADRALDRGGHQRTNHAGGKTVQRHGLGFVVVGERAITVETEQNRQAILLGSEFLHVTEETVGRSRAVALRSVLYRLVEHSHAEQQSTADQ